MHYNFTIINHRLTWLSPKCSEIILQQKEQRLNIVTKNSSLTIAGNWTWINHKTTVRQHFHCSTWQKLSLQQAHVAELTETTFDVSSGERTNDNSCLNHWLVASLIHYLMIMSQQLLRFSFQRRVMMYHTMCRRRRHRVASSDHRVAHHGPVRWSVSRGWHEQIQCRCGVDLSSEREDDQDDASNPYQVNDRMLGQLGNWIIEGFKISWVWPVWLLRTSTGRLPWVSMLRRKNRPAGMWKCCLTVDKYLATANKPFRRWSQ